MCEKIQINTCILLDWNASSNTLSDHAGTFECELEACEDSIRHFMENEDCTHNDCNECNDENVEKNNNNNNKAGRKVFCGGPSEEKFFSFTHTLRDFSDQIE